MSIVSRRGNLSHAFEENAENFEGVDGASGISNAVRVGAFVPNRKSIPQILLAGFGQHGLAQLGDHLGPFDPKLLDQFASAADGVVDEIVEVFEISRTSGDSGSSRVDGAAIEEVVVVAAPALLPNLW